MNMQFTHHHYRIQGGKNIHGAKYDQLFGVDSEFYLIYFMKLDVGIE